MMRITSDLRLGRLVGVGAALFSSVCLAAQTPTFSVKALVNFGGGSSTSVAGINNVGEAVGSVGGGTSACPTGCPAVWSNGTLTLLGSVAGSTVSVAYSINNAGQVAGIAVIAGNQQAVVWNNGIPTLLASPGAQYTQTLASHINDSGQVIGQSLGQVGGVEPVATVWNGLTPTVLGVAAGYVSARGWGINNNGLIVGTLCCNGQNTEAAVWHGATASLLPVLMPSAGAAGQALAINSSGLTVGQASNSAGSNNGAVAWSKGVITSLGSLDGISYATALNDRGIIGGYSSTPASGQRAVIWSRVGAEPADLNTLISATASAEITLTAVTGINNNCAIVANGTTKKTGANTAFILTLIDASKCVNGL